MRKAVVGLMLTALLGMGGCAGVSQSDTIDPRNVNAADSAQSPDDIVATAGYALVSPFTALADWMRNSDNNPARAARRLEDPTFADERRKGMVDLVVRFNKEKGPYVVRYRQIAKTDPDSTVRAMAIRALNICRDKDSTAIYIAALEDENELVRLEGAKALANLPDPRAVPALMERLEGHRAMVIENQQTEVEEGKDVRIAAADALRQYHTLEVARVLVEYLSESDFAVAVQARRSLVAITGRDLRYDEAAWLEYLTGPDKPLG